MGPEMKNTSFICRSAIRHHHRRVHELIHGPAMRAWQVAYHPFVEMLLSGHHQNICAWRTEQAEMTTKARRPDLWDRYQRDLKNQKEQCHERD